MEEVIATKSSHIQQPERSWEVDLEDLERQIDDNTAAMMLNTPSNPCGSVYSRQHLLDILAVAEKHRIPIISDEIYDGMVNWREAEREREREKSVY